MFGLYPRNGYKPVSIGRAITCAEWDALVSRLNLTDEKISGIFEEVVGEAYGDAAVKMTCRQIAVNPPGQAPTIAAGLCKSGVEAFSGSPGRVNIRIDPSVDYRIPMEALII
jgi:hypothetical protein